MSTLEFDLGLNANFRKAIQLQVTFEGLPRRKQALLLLLLNVCLLDHMNEVTDKQSF